MEQNLPRPFHYAPPTDPALTVVHHDDDILVLDKPSGLLTVEGKTADLADCLEQRAQTAFPGALIVHRLDKDTSGLIVLGLNPRAHANLGMQFEKRQTSKTYIALVSGDPTEDSGRIDAPVTTDWPNRPMQHIDRENGREAITEWEVLRRENGVTRILLKPQTGRTHQLRVHMLHIGCPILGDNLYADDDVLAAAPRLQLHAQSLSFTHPVTGDELVFESPCPF